MNLRPKGWPIDLTPATAAPISLEEAKAHLRVMEDDEDDLIEALLFAAIEHAEHFTGLTITPRQREVAFDAFPTETTDGLELGTWPVHDAQITFTVNGVEDIVSSSSETVLEVELDTYSRPAVITATSWPSADARASAVRVSFSAGFQSATDSTDTPDYLPLPAGVRAAVLLMLGHLYANREASVDRALSEVPFGIDALLRPHRMLLGMA
jgi:uncharacterized phiE125 gp8 family phage protein